MAVCVALGIFVLLPGLAAAQSPPAPVVAGVVIETTTSPPSVAGVVVQQQTLPRTGSNLVPMIGIALALVALGVLLVISVRRRRTHDVSLA